MFGTFATRLLHSPLCEVTGSEMCKLNERGRESKITRFIAKMEIVNLLKHRDDLNNSDPTSKNTPRVHNKDQPVNGKKVKLSLCLTN
jgi:hypothetical protein